MSTFNADIVLCWPDNMDYPLCRDFLLTHRKGFNKIIIVFTKTNRGIDYTQFVKDSIKAYDYDKQFVLLDSVPVKGDQDWRNIAVNQALEHSTSKWVWFMEQDLFVLSDTFWLNILEYMRQYDVIGYKDGATRLHPSNLWVKRHTVNRTSKDFGIVPGKLDHFAKFYTSLRLINAVIKQIPNDEKLFHHMNGLSSNLSLVQEGNQPNYQVEDFKDYLEMTLDIEPIDERYKKMCEDFLK